MSFRARAGALDSRKFGLLALSWICRILLLTPALDAIVANAQEEPELHFDGEYWGLWGPQTACRYSFTPTGDGTYVGRVVEYHENGSEGVKL